MSKLLRLPLALLAVLAALFFLPGVASATQPTAEQCTATPSLEGCPTPPDNASGKATTGDNAVVDPSATVPTGDSATGGSPAGGVQNRVQSAVVQPDVTPAATPNCDALPGIGLLPCSLPNCTPAPTGPLALDAPPPCLPAPPPSCVPVPGLGGLCQFPDSDCPPAPTAPTAAAVTDGTCTPPITCDQFAQLFGFGDSCGDIPMCIPRDRVPAGFPIPIPSPPLCGPGAGGTPPSTPPGKGTYMPPSQPAAQDQQPTYYANCTDARAHGATNIPQGSPGYRPELDADHDGFACDEAQTTATPTVTTAQPTGHLAYTGLELGPQLNVAWTLLVLGGGMLILGRRRA